MNLIETPTQAAFFTLMLLVLIGFIVLFAGKGN